MDKIWIRALEPEDYKVTHKWRQDEAAWSGVVGLKRYVSLETERKWVLKAIEDHESGKVLRFVLCMEGNTVPVGLMTAASIDNVNRSCSISSMVDPDHRSKGVIGKGRIQVFHYLYSHLGMERIWSHILEDNKPSRRAVEKFGITMEGVLRKAVYKDGVFKSIICYSMLKNEFYEIHGESLSVKA